MLNPPLRISTRQVHLQLVCIYWNLEHDRYKVCFSLAFGITICFQRNGSVPLTLYCQPGIPTVCLCIRSGIPIVCLYIYILEQGGHNSPPVVTVCIIVKIGRTCVLRPYPCTLLNSECLYSYPTVFPRQINY